MKKLVILIFLLSAMALFAQTPTTTAAPDQKGFAMSGVVGSVTIGDVTYSQICLRPEVAIWKFGIGLDFDLLIDKDGNVRKEDWDKVDDILNKIYYVRFAHRGDPFYARIGGFPDYTLTHGLIMNGYSNMLQYPSVRQIGGMMGFNTPISGLGFEGFSSNLQKNQILAGRIHGRPLETMSIPLLKRLDVGVSAATDRDQWGGLKDVTFDSDNDGVPDNRDIDADNDGLLDNSPYVLTTYPVLVGVPGLDDHYPNVEAVLDTMKADEVTVYGMDYELPLMETKAFYLSHYAEVAQIQNYNMGFIFPGFYSKFLIFQMNLEMRHFQDKFIPGYFDQLYDSQRGFTVNLPNGDTGLMKKEQLIEEAKAATGWYGSLTSNIFNVVSLTISYQDMYGDSLKTGKSIWGKLAFDTKVIPKIHEASISYSQVNVEKIRYLQTESAILEGKIAYGMADNADLVWKYQERYTDLNGSGKIDSQDEIIKSFGAGVEFKF